MSAELVILRCLCPLLLAAAVFLALRSGSGSPPAFDVNDGFFAQRSPAASDDQRAVLHMLWSTPVLHLNLFRALADPASPLARINAGLTDVLMRAYRDFEANATGQADSAATLNDRFFYYQTHGGWDLIMSGSPAVSWLYRWWQDVADQLLQLVGATDQAIAARDRSTAALHAWASISNSESAYHALHTHPDSLLSGVYYVSVGAGAGKLIFHDPRGPFVPFENTLEITPQEGDLVLFPSWLPHSVAPSQLSDRPRISIAFNLPGSWETTCSISTQIPLS